MNVSFIFLYARIRLRVRRCLGSVITEHIEIEQIGDTQSLFQHKEGAIFSSHLIFQIGFNETVHTERLRSRTTKSIKEERYSDMGKC